MNLKTVTWKRQVSDTPFSAMPMVLSLMLGHLEGADVELKSQQNRSDNQFIVEVIYKQKFYTFTGSGFWFLWLSDCFFFGRNKKFKDAILKQFGPFSDIL